MYINSSIGLSIQDKIEKLVEIKVIGEFGKKRVYIYIGTLMIAMSIDQFLEFTEKINEKALPILEERAALENQSKGENQSAINLELGDNLDMKDSIGG